MDGMEGMDGYQQRTEKKKQAIRHAAFDLFAFYGIEKVSLAEIARKANVSPVTIYNYFGTKDELVKTVLSSFLEEAWQKHIELMKSDLSFPEKIKKMMFDTEEYMLKWNKDILDRMLSNDPEWRAGVEIIVGKAMPEVIRFVELGKKEGYIDENLSTETILVYFNLLKEIKLTSAFKEISTDARKMEELQRVFFYGLFNRNIDKE
ncbi:TetR/AcrR family transcriptional regulator [Paenibacillus harenae]|uniref:TetR/AcrR family transcriptional regulator n=1 Tax=Paenibacillus harenae TaxID=306543 RepID=UPI00049065DE|nr:TetR/AcrR family transcriptional regulator [Paenibacillus harenae]